MNLNNSSAVAVAVSELVFVTLNTNIKESPHKIISILMTSNIHFSNIYVYFFLFVWNVHLHHSPVLNKNSIQHYHWSLFTHVVVSVSFSCRLIDRSADQSAGT